MARNYEESDWQDLGCDPEETHRSTRRHSNKPMGAIRSGKIRQQVAKSGELYGARRLVDAESESHILRIVTDTLQGFTSQGVTISKHLGLSVLSHNRTQSIYNDHFRSGNNARIPRDSFNQVVLDFVQDANRLQPSQVVGLGKLGLFGAKDTTVPGTRHLAFEIAEPGRGAVMVEQRALLVALSESRFCTREVEDLRGRVRLSDHINFGKALDYETAEEVISALEEAGVPDLLRTELQSSPSGSPIVQLGQMVHTTVSI